MFVVPAVALYGYFFALPVLQSFQYATTDWDGVSATYETVGLDNLTRVLGDDSLFTNALTNNLWFLLTVVVVQTLMSLLLAVLLVRNTRPSTFLRALFFVPAILSSVSVAFVWSFMYEPGDGLLNQGWSAIGLDSMRSSYLGEPGMAIVYVGLVQAWAHIGQLMIIFIAGLQQIPAELYEAAELDGAGTWTRFRHITWPLIAPATTIVVSYTTIQSFKAFDLILGLSGNPPSASLDILSTRIYTTYSDSEFGYAAAQSIIFMIIIAAVTVMQRRALRLSQQEV
ncbi:ABC transporter permease [Nocardioides sp. Soil805]|nr:ABC transporter permease [Nocardioides sp. Soil805]